MPDVPFENNEPPWGPEPVHTQPPIPEQRADEDLLFWEDKEIMESKTVGDTHYTRAFIRGTDQDAVWATRDSGQIEQVSSSLYGEDSPSAQSVFRALTSPDAPTELGEQMQHEQELADQPPPWADREVEIDRLLLEYPDQVDMAREDFENGELDQAGYDERIAGLETFKQSLEDELKTYEIERGESAAQEPILDQYAQELAEDGITGQELAAHDWQQGQDSPGIGDDQEPATAPAAEPEVSAPEPPAPEPPAIDHGDDFDMDM